MGARTLAASFVLFCALAIPIALVEWRTGEVPADDPVSPAPADPGKPSAVDPGKPSTGDPEPAPRQADASRTTSIPPRTAPGTREPDPAVRPFGPALEDQDRWLVHGVARDNPYAPAVGRLWQVDTPRGSRPLATGEDGSFAFVLGEADFPALVRDEEEQIRARLDEPPAAPRSFLNIQSISARRPQKKIFHPRSVSALRSGEEVRIAVFGKSRLPEGSSIILRVLAGADKSLVANLQYSADERLGEVVLTGRRLYSGNYKAVLEWKTVSGSDELLTELQEVLRDDPEDSIPGVVMEQHRFYMGRPEEEDAQKREIQAYYLGALGNVLGTQDLLRWAGAVLRKEPVKVSESRQKEVARHPGYETIRSMLRSKRFDEKKWRQFIDSDIPGLLADHRDPGKIPFPEKHPTLAKNLPLLQQTLVRMAKLESRMIYKKLGRSPALEDHVSIEMPVETEYKLARRMIRQFVKSMRPHIPRF